MMRPISLFFVFSIICLAFGGNVQLTATVETQNNRVATLAFEEDADIFGDEEFASVLSRGARVPSWSTKEGEEFWVSEMKKGVIVTSDGKCGACCHWFELKGQEKIGQVCGKCAKKWILYDGPCFKFPESFRDGSISNSLADKIKEKCRNLGTCSCTRKSLLDVKINHLTINRKTVAQDIVKAYGAVTPKVAQTYPKIKKYLSEIPRLVSSALSKNNKKGVKLIGGKTVVEKAVSNVKKIIKNIQNNGGVIKNRLSTVEKIVATATRNLPALSQAAIKQVATKTVSQISKVTQVAIPSNVVNKVANQVVKDSRSVTASRVNPPQAIHHTAPKPAPQVVHHTAPKPAVHHSAPASKSASHSGWRK